MAKKKADRDVEKEYARAQYLSKLARFADALKQGKSFSIQVAKERIVVPGSARISVEHEREAGNHALEFQISWSDEVKLKQSAAKNRKKSAGPAKRVSAVRRKAAR